MGKGHRTVPHKVPLSLGHEGAESVAIRHSTFLPTVKNTALDKASEALGGQGAGRVQVWKTVAKGRVTGM